MQNHTWGVRLRAMGAVAACSLALVACGGDKDDDTAPAAKDETASASPDDDLGGLLGSEPTESEETEGLEDGGPQDLPADEAEVVVLDYGDEPRAVPSIDLEEGQRSTSTLQMRMAVAFNGKKSPSIPMTMVMAVEVQDVTEELTTVRTTYDDVSVDDTGLPGELVDELESGLASLEGLAITIDQSPSGALLDTRFSLPDNAPSSAHQMVEQIAGSVASYAVPFPTEPLGEGASWTVSTTVDTNGLTSSQTTTYVLEEFDGERYRISTDIEGTFEPVELSGVKLVRGSMAGSGETSGELGQMMPSLGTSEGSTTMVMKVGGRRVATKTDIDMTITTEAD